MKNKRKKHSTNHPIALRKDINQLVFWKPTELTTVEREKETQDFLQQEQRGTYSEFYNKYSHEKIQAPSRNQNALMVTSTAVLSMHKDSLEELRRQRGLDKYREKLLQSIHDNISFEEGLEKILFHLNTKKRSLLREHKIKKATSLEHVSILMPEISASEIAWISTLKEVPKVYFDYENGVPTILDFNIDGIEFGFDGLNPNDFQLEISPDPFVNAGFTGISTDAEFYEFSAPFKKAFHQIGMLILSDSFIYQKCYESNKASSLIKGDGRLKRTLIERDPASYGVSLEQLKNTLLQNLPIDRKKLQNLEDLIKKILTNKNVFDLGRNNLCSPLDLITIIGILNKVPEPLISEDAFEGYILPFGKGLKIINSDGKEIEYIPFTGYLQLEAQEGLYHLSEDISRKNVLFSLVFNEYAKSIEAKFNEPEILKIDRLREIFRKTYEIEIPSRSTKNLTKVNDPMIHSFSKTSGEDNEMMNYTLKMGVFEMESLINAISNIPKKLIPEIRMITREYESADSPSLILGGIANLGQYNKLNKRITLYTPENEQFHHFSALEQQIFGDTLIHEIAHGIWDNLDQEIKKRWKHISKANYSTKLTDNYKRAFVYDMGTQRRAYSDISLDGSERNSLLTNSLLKEEDFCEHFAAYINHAIEFRELSEQSEDLARKYGFLKKLFTSFVQNNEQAEFNTSPIATLKMIDQHKSHLIKRRSLEEALLLQDRKHMRKEQLYREIREAFVPSLESMEMDEEEVKAYNHIYGQKNQEYLYLLQEISNFISEGHEITKVDPRKLMNLVENSSNGVVSYLISKFQYLDPKETREFVRDLKEGLYDLRIDITKPRPII